VKHHLVEVDGSAVSYYTAGEPTAPAVVLLHGGGQTASTWRGVVAKLADRYNCIAPDLRGHGDTSWQPDGSYSLAGHAGDLQALLEHLGVSRPHLVGMSLGGQTALHAACHGLELTSLTLVDVGPRLVEEGGAEIRDFLARWSFPSFEDALDHAAAFSPGRTRESLAQSLTRNMRQLPDGGWSWKWDPRRSRSRWDRAAQAAALMTLLAQISSPVLVVRGARSSVFSTELAEEFLAALRDAAVDARLVTIPGAGHAVQTDQPAALAGTIEDFYSRLPLRVATGHDEMRTQS
jgi:pimeloyl-ACP methyl ester carboxylesterase